MKDELKGKIAFELASEMGYEDACKHADQILSLLDAQRCVWTWEKDINLYSTSCGDAWPLAKPFAFCPRCGKRISISEVKDGQG